MIYLAPLQGFTDFVYRNSYSEIFSDIDVFFTPYVSMKNAEIIKKQLKEIIPGNNNTEKIVPQILVKNSSETNIIARQLIDFGYKKANLNLGCPYPMVTNRGKGSALLPYPEKIREILETWFKKYDMALSVKLRAGLLLPNEIDKVVPVLNDFPIHEVILHPRTAKQLYSGNIFDDIFMSVKQNIKHDLVYNGDLFSVSDFEKRRNQFPHVNKWMLGRGVLMNPFLPEEIKGKNISSNERKEKLYEFHNKILENYLSVMDNEGNAINKMKQFWIYFSHNFPNQKKAFKLINKSKKLSKFNEISSSLFASL